MGAHHPIEARPQGRSRRRPRLLAGPGQAAGRPALPRIAHRPAHGHHASTRRSAGWNHADPASAAPRSARGVQDKTGGSVGMAATKITPKDFVAALKDWSILDV